MVKRLNDAFQAAKSMGRQAVKIVAAYAQQLTSKIRPFFDENKIYSLCWCCITTCSEATQLGFRAAIQSCLSFKPNKTLMQDTVYRRVQDIYFQFLFL